MRRSVYFRRSMRHADEHRYGIIGHPIAHSRSPAMQNAAFHALKIPATYAAWDVPPRGLRRWLATAPQRGVCGFNVTVPHKERVAEWLGASALSREARLIGAVNTVVKRGGRWTGHNTDAHGFLTALQRDLGWRPRGRRAVVLGAGGAARAVCIALVQAGASQVVIANRTRERAQALARWMRQCLPDAPIVTIGWSAEVIGCALRTADLLVNATSVGLHAGHRLPVNAGALHRGLVVYDLVYGRSPTRLVAHARRRGLVASDGLGMLLYQGARAFALWTRRRAPLAVMRRGLQTKRAHQ